MDIYFNAYKVKYEKMDELTAPIFRSRPIKTINIFINLDDVFNHLKNVKANHDFQCCGISAPKQLISNVMNLIAHYRQWGIRKHVNVKMFAFCTSHTCRFENSIHIPEYRQEYTRKASINNPDCFFVNNTIDLALPSLRMISNYINGVYVIDSKYIEPSAIPYFISTKVRNADWNLVLSRDIVDYQNVLFDRFNVILPKGEDSIIISASNLWSVISDKEKVSSIHLSEYPPELFIILLATMGNKLRSIPKLKRVSWISIFHYLDDIVEETHGLSFTTITDKLLSVLSAKCNNMNEITNNTLVLNMKSNVTNMDEITIEMIKTQMIDTPDYNNLLELNRLPNMFASYPINLKFLTDEGDFATNNPFIK